MIGVTTVTVSRFSYNAAQNYRRVEKVKRLYYITLLQLKMEYVQNTSFTRYCDEAKQNFKMFVINSLKAWKSRQVNSKVCFYTTSLETLLHLNTDKIGL